MVKLFKIFFIVLVYISISKSAFATTGKPIIMKSIIGDDDDREIVKDYKSAPNRTIVYLDITFPNGANPNGTGVMISKDTVLTAAHNLYDKNAGGYAKKIDVYAGTTNAYYDAKNNYIVKYDIGKSTGIKINVLDEWTNKDIKEKQIYDVGTLRLSSNLGNETGITTMSSNIKVSDKELIKVIGYPYEQENNGQLRTGSGYIKELKEHQIFYNVDTITGQSGSPVLNKSNQIIGVHTYGLSAKTSLKYNSATRMTDNLIKKINQWVQEPLYSVYKKDVVILKAGENIYKDLSLSSIVNTTDGRIDEIYFTTKIYEHLNNNQYIDLCDPNKCYGYINKNAIVDLRTEKYEKTMVLSSLNYEIDDDLYGTYNPNSSNMLLVNDKYYNQKVKVKNKYYKNDTLLYYDVYDMNDKFLGFIYYKALTE